MNKKILWSSAVAAGLLLCFLQVRQPVETASPKAAARAALKKPKENARVTTEDNQLKPERTLASRRRQYNRRLLHGIKTLPTKKEQQNYVLTVVPAPEARWCSSGDFDLLKATTQDLKQDVFTVSLEALSGSGSGTAQSLSLGDISARRAIALRVPQQAQQATFGLFLCSDPQRTHSCRTKEPISKQVWKLPLESLASEVMRRIIYFQSILVDQDGVHLMPSQDWSEKQLQKVQDAMIPTSSTLSSTSQQARGLLSSLEPMPARVNGMRLEIPLPYNDQRCFKAPALLRARR